MVVTRSSTSNRRTRSKITDKTESTIKGRSKSASPIINSLSNGEKLGKRTIRRNPHISPTINPRRYSTHLSSPLRSSRKASLSPSKSLATIKDGVARSNSNSPTKQRTMRSRADPIVQGLQIGRKTAQSNPRTLSDLERLFLTKGKEKAFSSVFNNVTGSRSSRRKPKKTQETDKDEIGKVYRARLLYASSEPESDEGEANFESEEEEKLLTDFSEQEDDDAGDAGEEEEDDDDEIVLEEDELTDKEKEFGRVGSLQGEKAKTSPSSSQFQKSRKNFRPRRPRGISSEDRTLIEKAMKERDDPAVIVSSATFNPYKRRSRVPWTASEVLHLRMGVERFGSAWSDILKCPDYKFKPHRTQVDLKDKWRNITAYRPYSSNIMRDFILVDENHAPIMNPATEHPYRFRNRWPREAALKAATKDVLYSSGQDRCVIYIREVDGSRVATSYADLAKSGGSSGTIALPPIVHVYEGVRIREAAPPHLSHHAKLKTIWTTEVRKIREERYVTKEDFSRLQREAHLRGL